MSQATQRNSIFNRGINSAANDVVWAGALMVAFNLFFIFTFGSRVFTGDEWDDFASLLNRFGTHGFDWRLFWEPVNEHRLVLIKLIYFLQSSISTDPRWMMVLSTICWWLTLRELAFAAPLLPPRDGVRQSVWLKRSIAFVLGLFFFSLIQSENFYTGMQLCYMAGVFGSVGAIVSASHRRFFRMLLFLLLNYLALSSWIGLIPSLTWILFSNWRAAQTNSPSTKNSDLQRLVIFLLISAAALALYLFHLDTLGDNSLSMSFSARPLHFLLYVLMLIATPFASMGFYVALPMSIVGLAICWRVFRLRHDGHGQISFAIALHGLILAVMIARGRAGQCVWGDVGPLRYSSFFLPLWFVLGTATYRIFAENRRALTALALILFVNLFVADPKGFDHERGGSQTRDQSGACLEHVLQHQRFSDAATKDLNCAIRIYSDTTIFRKARRWKQQGRRILFAVQSTEVEP